MPRITAARRASNRSRPKGRHKADARHGVLPEALFLEEFARLGSFGLAQKYKLNIRGVQRRRTRLETKLGRKILPPVPTHTQYRPENFPGRENLAVMDGVVIVAGDPHYWPLPPPLMHRALIHFLNCFRERKTLRAVIMNGDVTDFSSISRWPQVDWERRPSIKDEIDTCVDRMHEIAVAAGKVPKYWPLGNHDARWSVYLAAKVPEFANVNGLHLRDHFPLWQACWSVMISGNTLVKHTYKGGEYSTFNNVKAAGCHVITNHQHSAKVSPITTLAGTLYGVDTGCLADCFGPQFLYLQDNPRNWRSAFSVLTYRNGLLMQPELVLAWDRNSVQFRGEIITP
jgi:hypothetical protein